MPVQTQQVQGQQVNYAELLEKVYPRERVIWEQMRQEGQTDKEIYEFLESWV